MGIDSVLEKVESEFFEALVHGESLDDLADMAYKYLGNPIMITNERGHIFSKARKNPPYDDAIFEEFAEKGYVTSRRMPYTSMHDTERKCSGKVIILDNGEVSHRRMFCQKTVNTDFIYRTIMLESKRPFSEYDEQIFDIFTKAIGYFLSNSSLVKNFRSNTLEYFLGEMLSGGINCFRDEEDVVEYLNLSRGVRLSLLSVKNVFGIALDAVPLDVSGARKELEKIFPGCISVILDGYIVLLLKQKVCQSERSEELRRAENYLRANHLKGCLSRTFESCRLITDYFAQTKSALNLAMRFNSAVSIYFLDDYFDLCILESIGEEKLITYCYLPLLDLLRKDKNEDRDLMLTLYAYSMCFGRATAAAKLLGIHYNTLKQRLNVIEATIGVEFRTILPTVYISILIIRLLRLDPAEKYAVLDTLYRETERC